MYLYIVTCVQFFQAQSNRKRTNAHMRQIAHNQNIKLKTPTMFVPVIILSYINKFIRRKTPFWCIKLREKVQLNLHLKVTSIHTHTHAKPCHSMQQKINHPQTINGMWTAHWEAFSYSFSDIFFHLNRYTWLVLSCNLFNFVYN